MFEFADTLVSSAVALQETPTPAGGGGLAVEDFALGMAALGVGLAALGSGIAERGIGAAAVGALAEDSISIGIALLMTVLPETLVILALLVVFLSL